MVPIGDALSLSMLSISCAQAYLGVMPRTRIDMDVFAGLDIQDQLAHIMARGELMKEGTNDSQFLYRLDDYYVRVRVSSSPLKVQGITASREVDRLL